MYRILRGTLLLSRLWAYAMFQPLILEYLVVLLWFMFKSFTEINPKKLCMQNSRKCILFLTTVTSTRSTSKVLLEPSLFTIPYKCVLVLQSASVYQLLCQIFTELASHNKLFKQYLYDGADALKRWWPSYFLKYTVSFVWVQGQVVKVEDCC